MAASASGEGSDAWPLLDHYPHATIAGVDGAGHNGHIEQGVLFNAFVQEWLDRVEGRNGSPVADPHVHRGR